MKALTGTLCALLAAGCAHPGPLVSHHPTLLPPYAVHSPAPPIRAASGLASHADAALPVVALPAELFAPAPALAGNGTPVRLASRTVDRPGLVETALFVSDDGSADGPMLVPHQTHGGFREALVDGHASTVTASAGSVTVVGKHAAPEVAALPPEVAFAQTRPAIVQPRVPATPPPYPSVVGPGGPGGPGVPVGPGGPAVIQHGAPVLTPGGAVPWSGMPAGAGPGCDPCPPWSGGGMVGGYDPCNPCAVACGPTCPVGFTVFGEYLFLSARGASVPFATPVDGLGINAVPIGRTLVADPEHDHGFRVGGMFALGPQTGAMVMYTKFKSRMTDGGSLPGGTGFYRATLVHPNTTNVAADSLAAGTRYDIDFQFADLALGHDFYRDWESRVAGVIGLRYGKLDQELVAAYSILGATLVGSDIEFEGLGPRLGFEAERHLLPGFSLYGNAFASFLAGRFDSRYVQLNVNDPAPQVVAAFRDDRIVPILEGEIGVTFCPPCGGWRLSLGYYLAGWFNVVTTAEFIEAVQTDRFHGVRDTLTFDGLTVRLMVDF